MKEEGLLYKNLLCVKFSVPYTREFTLLSGHTCGAGITASKMRREATQCMLPHTWEKCF